MTGAMFFLSVSYFMNNYMGTTQVFQTERPVLLREQANKMYDVVPYYMTKMIAEMPVYLVIPAISVPIVYFGIGFTITLHQYLYFLLAASCQI